MSKTLYERDALKEYFNSPEQGDFTMRMSPQWLHWLWGTRFISEDGGIGVIYAVNIDEDTREVTPMLQLEKRPR